MATLKRQVIILKRCAPRLVPGFGVGTGEKIAIYELLKETCYKNPTTKSLLRKTWSNLNI